jgi:hypothetical protein
LAARFHEVGSPNDGGFLDSLATGRELFIAAEGMLLRFPLDGVSAAISLLGRCRS